MSASAPQWLQRSLGSISPQVRLGQAHSQYLAEEGPRALKVKRNPAETEMGRVSRKAAHQ
jgi:hypothetical protein